MKLGGGKQGFNAKFDTLPSENQVLYARHMSIIVEVDEGEEEVK